MQKEKNKNTGLYNLQLLGNYLPAEDRQIVIGGLELGGARANDLWNSVCFPNYVI